jgi:hypothetical protein
VNERKLLSQYPPSCLTEGSVYWLSKTAAAVEFSWLFFEQVQAKRNG